MQLYAVLSWCGSPRTDCGVGLRSLKSRVAIGTGSVSGTYVRDERGNATVTVPVLETRRALDPLTEIRSLRRNENTFHTYRSLGFSRCCRALRMVGRACSPRSPASRISQKIKPDFSKSAEKLS